MSELFGNIVGLEEVGCDGHRFNDSPPVCCDENRGSAERMDTLEFGRGSNVLVAFMINEGIRNSEFFEEPKNALRLRVLQYQNQLVVNKKECTLDLPVASIVPPRLGDEMLE